MVEVLKPLAEFVAKKLIQLKARRQGIEEYNKLLVELRNVKDNDKGLTITEELGTWDQDLEKLTTPLASQGKRGAEMISVAQYHDEWVNTESGQLKAWCVCLQAWGGQYPPCGTVMPATHWEREFEDIGTPTQKWY